MNKGHAMSEDDVSEGDMSAVREGTMSEGEAAYDAQDPFVEVRGCLERGELQRAQALLEQFGERGAEWYFVQAKIFRAKKWYSESRRCLKRALAESPENETYRKEYNDLIFLAQKGKIKKQHARADMGATAQECCAEAACTGLCTCLGESCDGS